MFQVYVTLGYYNDRTGKPVCVTHSIISAEKYMARWMEAYRPFTSNSRKFSTMHISGLVLFSDGEYIRTISFPFHVGLAPSNIDDIIFEEVNNLDDYEGDKLSVDVARSEIDPNEPFDLSFKYKGTVTR